MLRVGDVVAGDACMVQYKWSCPHRDWWPKRCAAIWRGAELGLDCATTAPLMTDSATTRSRLNG